MGAVSALQQVGNTDVKVFSMGAYGAEPFGMLYENDPNYVACLNVDAWGSGAVRLRRGYRLLRGQTPMRFRWRPTSTWTWSNNSNVTDFWTFEE